MLNMTFILFVDYEKVNYNIWVFQNRKNAKNNNNNKINVGDAMFLTSNVNIPISENTNTKFQKFEII